MNAEFDWIRKLQTLAMRYSHLGLTPDFASLSLVELYGVYVWLRNMDHGA